jgi:hypothetical protein
MLMSLFGVACGSTDSDQGGSSSQQSTDAEERGEEYIPVVMRVSGEQGTRYSCNHSDISSEGYPVQAEEQGELGASPVEYRARVRTDSSFYGYCSIDNPQGSGRLKLELLVNGRVVDSAETQPDPPGLKSARSSFVDVSYPPQTEGPDPAKGRGEK